MGRRLVVVMVTLVLLAACQPASGWWQRFTGDDKVIEPGHPLSWRMNSRPDMAIKVTYDIEVVAGDPVNVLFMTIDDYELYEDGLDFDHISSRSKTAITDADTEFKWEGTDDYRFVIETTNGTSGNSTVDYEVEYDYVAATGWGSKLGTCAIIVTVVLVVALVSGLVAVMRKRKGPN